MSAHTKGPWKISSTELTNKSFPTKHPHYEIGAEGSMVWVAHVLCFSDAHAGSEYEANAKLIASAPDMLAALESIASHSSDEKAVALAVEVLHGIPRSKNEMYRGASSPQAQTQCELCERAALTSDMSLIVACKGAPQCLCICHPRKARVALAGASPSSPAAKTIDQAIDEATANMTPEQFEECVRANNAAMERTRQQVYARAGVKPPALGTCYINDTTPHEKDVCAVKDSWKPVGKS